MVICNAVRQDLSNKNNLSFLNSSYLNCATISIMLHIILTHSHIEMNNMGDKIVCIQKYTIFILFRQE